MRKSFVKSCEKMIRQGDNSVVILGDIGVYGFKKISSEFPSRVLNLGIMEQAMVGVGSGFASRGIIPTLHSIAPFLIERALEQIKIDFGYQNYPANFVSVGASFDYATLGCTHHCPADIPNLANIPGIDLFIPGHSEEFSKLFDSNWNSNSINYFRLTEKENLECHLTLKGESKLLKSGTKAIVIAVGPILDPVLSGLADLDVEIHYVNSILARENLKINTELQNVPIVIFEPYYPGTVLAKILSQVRDLKLTPMQFGVKKTFSTDYGSYENHLKFHELDSNSISIKVRQLI
jgi:transketolase